MPSIRKPFADEERQTKQRRRGHHEGTGYQRADGRWEWKVTLPDGTRKSFYAKTQRAAREKANEAIRQLNEGLRIGEAATITVKTFLDRWVDQTATERVRPSTLESYRGHIEHHINPRLGHKRLRLLAVQDVNDMLVAITATGASPSTANLVRATVRTALASALKWGYVPRNVAALSDARTVRKQRVQPLTVDQARLFLEKSRDHRLGMLFNVAIHTGMRQGELLALTWEDVDFDEDTIHIRHTLTKIDKKLTRTDPKTDQSRRSLKLSEPTIEALQMQQRRVTEAEQLAAGRWQENNLVFPSTIGTFLNSSNVTHQFQVMLEAHGLPRQRFHDLRHCTASILLAEGMDLFTVKEVLGHSQISLTADTYGHLTDKLSAEAARRIGQALREPAESDDN